MEANTILRSRSETMEEDSDSSQLEHPETEQQDYSKFSKSLQELKDLCTQLHHAADYCESTFLESNHRQLVVKNTKEYVCRAVVTVVDHLGSVSSNLDYHVSKTDIISHTQVRIDLLSQKLFICQEYSDKLALAKLSWRAQTPRYNSRYLKPPVSDVLSRTKSLRDTRSEIVANTVNNKQGFKIDEEVPLFVYTCSHKAPSSRFQDSLSETSEDTIDSLSLQVLPVRDGLSIYPKPQTSSFQLQDKRKKRRGTLFRKSMTSNEILSFIRKRK